MAKDESQETAPASEKGAPPPAARQEVRLDDENVAAVYANFCRLSGTPEEIVLDFSLNTRSTGELPEALRVDQRVVLNFYTAKRLLGALQMAVQRHEATFGALETDIRRRVAAASRPPERGG